MIENTKASRVERDGKVAVLVSPGFGAGWSTWAGDRQEEAIFCPEIVEMILAGRKPTEDDCKRIFGEDFYTGSSLRDLRVQWVTKGARFEIEEYDGSETLRVFGPDDGWTA